MGVVHMPFEVEVVVAASSLILFVAERTES